jgi:hypothetical protein
MDGDLRVVCSAGLGWQMGSSIRVTIALTRD